MKLDINQTLQQAITAQEESRLEEAEQLYQEILKTEPTNLDANNNLSIILFSLGRLDEAEVSCRKAIELKPDYTEAYNNLGVFLMKLNKFEKAEEAYKKAIELKPDYAEAYNNLGVLLMKLNKFVKAEEAYKKAIEFNADFADAHYNLGDIFQILDKLSEAEASYKKAIELKPDYAEAHNSLATILIKLDKLDGAEKSYRKAIELKPNYLIAYYNLASTLSSLGKLDEAEVYFTRALKLNPDYTEAYNNLGIVLYKLGKIDEAVASYKKAIKLQPDYAMAWQNIFFPLQVIKLQTSSVEDHLPLLDEQVTSKYAQAAKSILNYRLNLGSPLAKSSLNEVLSILSSADNTFIKNPKVPYSELNTEITLSKKITALVHFGRSGTGLLHSLIDGHPEVSTLPSIYFSEFFDHFSWEKIIAGGWEDMADLFTKTYAVLFDASSAIKIPSKNNQFIRDFGRREGMTTVGTKKDEVISINKKVFIKELKQLMDCHDRLDAFTFFKLVHSAYDKALQDHNEKKMIFYHIHNPDKYAQLNFLRLEPNTNWLMMVREPVQSCESWVMKGFYDNDQGAAAHKIFQMLFEVDKAIYQNSNSVGVRLEDLKEHPKKTIPALCSWLGIKEEDSLYQMTAQGKKWWGDQSSPDFEKDGMNPFGKTSINRKLGSVFSKNDQFIIQTLFYPFSVRFGYAEENLEKFKKDLQTIRPMLDQMFDFEKKIAQHSMVNMEKFIKSGSYLYLRSGMIERWNTLNKLHTYPNMLVPLKIN